MKNVKVSNNVIRRLPKYLRRLDELDKRGITRISSAELGRLMGITPSQIRQDLSSFGEFGLQGYGYHVTELRGEIASILGTDNGYRAVLIGVGNIGKALIDHFSFSACGVELQCAFDICPERADSQTDGLPVYHLTQLRQYLQTTPVDIAVLAVPETEAFPVTNLLAEYGIEAIWNFTNVDIADPDRDILVENVHFSDSLLALSYYLSQRRQSVSKQFEKVAI